MRGWLAGLVVMAVGLALGAAPCRAQEADSGWVSLLGADLGGWTRMNAGDWAMADGVLRYTGGGNGWLRTNERFGDFQLVVEWRYTDAQGPKDAGIFLRADAEGDPWPSQGHQMHLGPGDNLGGLAGARGARNRPDLVNPTGQWNRYEVIVVGDKATAIINDRKAWDAEGLRNPPGGGYLGLQGEGAPYEVRVFRVRRLDGPGAAAQGSPAGVIQLFNGRDLSGWVWSGSPQENPFRVVDGIIVCSGQPAGYIRTEKPYENYVFTVEWRYANPEREQGRNSGVLFHIQPPDKVWPLSQEAQMMPGSAGELLKVSGSKMEGDGRLANTEKPLGEWSRYEIVCKDGAVLVFMNGELVNQARNLEPRSGFIAVQSEGAEIHFRNLTLRPL